MSRFVVIGLGSFGASVVRALHELGLEVVALDVDPDKIERLANLVPRAVCGDGTDEEVLRHLGVRPEDVAVISTGDDVTTSVLVAIALRDFGVREVHVKVVSDIHARILEKVGVGHTVFPERESARLLAKSVATRTVLDYVALGPGLSAQEMAVPPSWVGRSLRDLELPRRYSISVIAVRDYLSGETSPIPDPDAQLKESDTLLVAGADRDLSRVAKAS